MEFSAPADAHGHADVLTPEDAFVAAANTYATYAAPGRQPWLAGARLKGPALSASPSG